MLHNMGTKCGLVNYQPIRIYKDPFAVLSYSLLVVEIFNAGDLVLLLSLGLLQAFILFAFHEQYTAIVEDD